MTREMRESGVPWLGRIPAGWSLVRAKQIFRLTNGRGNASNPVLLAATQKLGMWPQDRLEGVVRVKEDTDLSTFRTVHKNDFVISLRSFQGGFERSDFEGVCSPAYQTFCARNRIDHQYFKYLFKSPTFIDHMNSLTLGIREGKTIKFSDFALCELPVPSLNEQHRIADYLDAKCAEIDAAIQAAANTLDECNVYSQALITETINKGFGHPDDLTESNNEFISLKRKSWPLVQFKRIAQFLNGDRSTRYPSGDDIVPEGVPFVTSSELNGRHLARNFAKHITRAKYDSLSGVKLRINDVVYCLRGSVGKCALNTRETGGTIASSLTVARPSGCNPAWLNYALSSTSTTNQAIATAIGATSQNLAANVLEQAAVPLPPLDEQRQIADFLDCRLAAIDCTIAAKQSIIDDLKAYKQSLIYEVVTGKRDV